MNKCACCPQHVRWYYFRCAWSQPLTSVTEHNLVKSGDIQLCPIATTSGNHKAWNLLFRKDGTAILQVFASQHQVCHLSWFCWTVAILLLIFQLSADITCELSFLEEIRYLTVSLTLITTTYSALYLPISLLHYFTSYSLYHTTHYPLLNYFTTHNPCYWTTPITPLHITLPLGYGEIDVKKAKC